MIRRSLELIARSRVAARRLALLALLTVVTFGSLSAQTVSFVARKDFAVGKSPFSVAVGDFNGDCKPDLVVGNDETVSVLLGNGDGTLQPARDIEPPGYVAVGDFNGDGRLDLAVASGNTVSALLGNGDGTFQAPVNYHIRFGATSVVIDDFNGDGVLDLAVSNGNTVSVLLGNGDGTFQAPIDSNLSELAQHLAVGDFNGDRVPDRRWSAMGPVMSRCCWAMAMVPSRRPAASRSAVPVSLSRWLTSTATERLTW